MRKIHKIVKSILFNKFCLLIVILVIIIASIVLFIISDSKSITLDKFSDELYNYPLPPKTVVLERNQFDGKNWVDGGGSGGYWNVVVCMKLSTALNKDEILNYYKNVVFHYPRSNTLGAIPELYFEGDAIKQEHKEGFYFRGKEGRIREVSSYFDKNIVVEDFDKSVTEKGELTFYLQLISGYDYFLNLD